jgi:peptidyl-tRNA hydrolase, PTH2 family
MEELKQVILVRADIEMGRGKAAAQVGHAAVSSYLECLKAHKDIASEWLEMGQRKIVLKVDTEEALMKFYEAFKFKKIPCSLVSDAGLTQLPPGTKTALGVGPWKSADIDILTRGLKLF